MRTSFATARKMMPALLFFDEVDALVGDRSDGGDSVEARVLSTFLNEMDGVDVNGGEELLLIAATNRPCVLDPALVRPGRLEVSIKVSIYA